MARWWRHHHRPGIAQASERHDRPGLRVQHGPVDVLGDDETERGKGPLQQQKLHALLWTVTVKLLLKKTD